MQNPLESDLFDDSDINDPAPFSNIINHDPKNQNDFNQTTSNTSISINSPPTTPISATKFNTTLHSPIAEPSINSYYESPSINSNKPSSSSSSKPSVPADSAPNSQSKPKKNYSFEISITEPRKEGEGSANPYISYQVTTVKTNLDTSKTVSYKRRRRFKDFVWLHNNLAITYQSVAVPPLPGKHHLGKFGPEFVSRRKEALQRFLSRISRHPVLKQCAHFQTFSEATDWSSEYEDKSKKDTSVFEGLSDTLLNSFTKIKVKDDRFLNMADSISRVEENINKSLKVANKVLKNQSDLEKLYSDLSIGWNDLSNIEFELTPVLVTTSNTLNMTSEAIKILALLKSRDGKQIEYEELCEYLKTSTAEMNRLQNYQSASGVSLVTNFIKGKVRDLRGIDPSISRQNRIGSLKTRCEELETAMSSSKIELDRFNDDVLLEFDFFNDIKQSDIKRCLISLSSIFIEYFEKSNEVWSKLLPEIEQIRTD
ncbi:Sorting nexin-4 [Smittium culicis]|uniref:Sorting nexin-4 n=1 Tax=Smittium culicis TaxID=133412 RepID=A0A1R1X0A9_9FUNG|nr:Sorting nexin-4 [Smittium culicis]